MLTDLNVKSTGRTFIVKDIWFLLNFINKNMNFSMLKTIKVILQNIEDNLNYMRLNQTSILTERTGTFYGQCSEICGVWHGFMPIAVEAVSVQDYLVWLDSLMN